MRGKGLFFPRIPEVTSAHIRTMTENGGGGQSNRGRGTATDFDIDPQDYIDKAVKKYAGNTFVLPNQNDPDAEGEEAQTGHKTFFIPKNIQEEAKLRSD